MNKDKPSDYYAEKIHNVLIDNTQVQVKDIFDFEFDRAYVFKDNYYDGEYFARTYGLDISISEVKENYQEYIRRIVFVDKDGKFVYEFRYEGGKLIQPKAEGMVVCPDTVVNNFGNTESGAVIFEFLGLSQDDYY